MVKSSGLIKSTLSYSLNLINIHTLENKLVKVTNDYNSLLDDYNQLSKEQDVLSQENKELREDLEAINIEFSQFKSRYSDISSKDILEIFNLNELWQNTFHQELDDEERIVIATNNFKPDNIIVGQGFIAAESINKAIEWLNIVRTALIFVDNDNGNLNRGLSADNETEPSEVRDDYDIPNNFENFWD